MRIIFSGTPHFAAYLLEQLIAHPELRVVQVLTRPDQRSKRGLMVMPSAVKQIALQHQLPVSSPAKKTDLMAMQEQLRKLNADIMIVAAYGMIIPEKILYIPSMGSLNVHASLLPHWRGAAPIHRALLANDLFTGISIMKMDAGLDTGDVALQWGTHITENDTFQTLHDRLMIMGAKTLIAALERMLKGPLITYYPQNNAQSTYAEKIGKEETHINWLNSAELICCQLKTFDPEPGAWSLHGKNRLQFFSATLDKKTDYKDKPGTILSIEAQYLKIATTTYAINVREVKRAGGKRMSISLFSNGYIWKIGDKLN